MKTDIRSRDDLHKISTQFYDKLLIDEEMRPFFEEILGQHQLAQHLEDITDFWSDLLFDTQTYDRNVLEVHQRKNALISFQKEHFDRWMSYFLETIDALFEGSNAEKMKNSARSIATVMQLKMKVYP